MKRTNLKKTYKEILEELCEDIGINIEDADSELEDIAKEIAASYINEN